MAATIDVSQFLWTESVHYHVHWGDHVCCADCNLWSCPLCSSHWEYAGMVFGLVLSLLISFDVLIAMFVCLFVLLDVFAIFDGTA